jgi:Ca2+-binding EF-hand superfamily protein
MKGLLGERIFQLYDKCNSGMITVKDFTSISQRFFMPDFDEKLHLVFDIFDFNADGLIAEEDIRSILSHIPIDQIV